MANVNPYETPKAAVADATLHHQPVQLFSVSGRIGRARYIAYGLGIYLLLGILAAVVAGLIGPIGAGVVWVALMVILFMLTIQRCHDFNMSGWLSILVLVPFVNLIFWFIPGTDGPNRFGAPTPPNSVLVLIGAWLIPVVAVVGILAAVAIPAYQDYVKRAQQKQQPQQKQQR
jgi:uncharacterized membrane protein YhaH (DUF805 family)